MKGKGSKHAGSGSREADAPAPLPTIRKILATTDFSDHSRAGVRYAVRLAETLRAAVEVVYVIEPPPRMAGTDVLVPVPQIAEVTPRVRAHLEQLVREEARGDVRLSVSVGIGTPWYEITTRARVGAMDLVVLATHGHTGIKHALLGSTAERVVRHAPCPVLTVPGGVVSRRAREAPMLKVKRILVPVDFSKVSKRAIRYATALARQFSAELSLLHVVEHLAIDRILGLAQSAEALAASMKQARVELEAVAARVDEASEVSATATIRDGTPFREICDTAKRVGADLIVLTTRGQGGMTRVVLGSTAERVVRHAPCPVLAVRS
jgi:nucleotide-binding universal stress UspA family protein